MSVSFRVAVFAQPGVTRVFSVPVSLSLDAVLQFAAQEFKLDPQTCAFVTAEGRGLELEQPAGNAFATHGSDLTIIPRDRVG